MVFKKKSLIVLGGILMIAGFFSIVIALFYEFQVKPEMDKRNRPASAAKLDKAIEKPQGIGVDALMNYSKGRYDADETDRWEGTLWVDHAGKKLVVNLGVLNGLKSKDQLAVYDREQRIGRVQAADVFDVVSYVEIIEPLSEPMQKDYYRVEKE